MQSPMEICLEDLDLSPEDERYMRCVALPDSDPGLTLDSDGQIVWMPEKHTDTGLWVSDDDRLILIRPQGAAPMKVERAGRSLEVPAGKPVVLLHEDLLHIGPRRLVVHVHGFTEDVYAPEAVPASAFKRLAQTAAAAVAVGAAALAGMAGADTASANSQNPAIEVRRRPPKKPAPRPKDPVDCRVLSTSKSGRYVVARCPKNETRIYKGLRGMLYDKKGRALANGYVVVKSVSKGRVRVVATNTPKGKPVRVRFLVRRSFSRSNPI